MLSRPGDAVLPHRRGRGIMALLGLDPSGDHTDNTAL